MPVVAAVSIVVTNQSPSSTNVYQAVFNSGGVRACQRQTPYLHSRDRPIFLDLFFMQDESSPRHVGYCRPNIGPVKRSFEKVAVTFA